MTPAGTRAAPRIWRGYRHTIFLLFSLFITLQPQLLAADDEAIRMVGLEDEVPGWMRFVPGEEERWREALAQAQAAKAARAAKAAQAAEDARLAQQAWALRQKQDQERMEAEAQAKARTAAVAAAAADGVDPAAAEEERAAVPARSGVESLPAAPSPAESTTAVSMDGVVQETGEFACCDKFLGIRAHRGTVRGESTHRAGRERKRVSLRRRTAKDLCPDVLVVLRLL